MSKTSENIQSLRKAGLTQTEIAKKSGVPQCRISRWEKGGVPKAADDALKLADLARSLSDPATATQQEPAHA